MSGRHDPRGGCLMPGMEPTLVFIAPLGSDPSQADTWLPIGTLNEPVEHEPADTTPANPTTEETTP